MRVLVTRQMPPDVLYVLEASHEVTRRQEDRPLTLDEARAALAEYDVILPTLGDAFRADAFTGAIRTRLLANFGVGYNHIDVAAARAGGVAVTNTPGAVTDATADIGMMLILMTCRRASEGERLVRSGAWSGWAPTQLLGLHLGGKTLGVVGMGRIGKAIARRATAFGMRIVFHNRSRVEDPGVPARQVDLTELLGTADVVVLAVPATPDTRHLIDARALAAMRPTARLVNIARGDIVDEAALIDALRSGTIAAAGLDVYEHEPAVPEALCGMENVSILPHLGTSALEVRQAMGRMAVDNILAFAEGRDLPNQV
jgi:lactate dehydrogenase-like 2-hydroxyacid dehydrogenase